MSSPDNNILFLNFADSKVPEFKEMPNKEWVLYGEDNQYPNRLLYLYNKSSKHNAIINGKVNYIYGKGLTIENDAKGEQLLNKCNRYGESLSEIAMKCVTDIELFGGFYIEVIWSMGGGISDIIHKPFEQMRVGKDASTFFYKEDWTQYNRVQPVAYPAFNPEKRTGSQIFYYKEYRPGLKYYPLPGYLGSINYIDCDIEISKYHLSAITNGMFPSKMIVFNNGEPTEEGKRLIEKGFKDKFAGAENAGRFMLIFGNDPAKAPIIQDLSATELDKQFTILNDTVQQEIFSGHGITSPALFGIMTAGKLGESNQLQEAYDIFKNTYADMKQVRFEEQLNYLTRFAGVTQPFKLQPVEPIGFKLSEAALLQIAPKDWLLEKAGVDSTLIKQPESITSKQIIDAINSLSPLVANKVLESMTEDEIRSLVSLTPKTQTLNPDGSLAPVLPATQVNDNLKNLTGKQMQNLMRIVRKYGKGELTKEQAKLMMQGGYGLTEMEIDSMLGENTEVEDV